LRTGERLAFACHSTTDDLGMIGLPDEFSDTELVDVSVGLLLSGLQAMNKYSAVRATAGTGSAHAR
jgi:hypothetical protein